jgi:choline monooxygenase
MIMISDQLGAAMRPLSEASSMPAGFYTDPEVFRAKREHILLASWIFLARDDQLPRPGDYRSFDTVGGPVLLVRGDDGVLRCFANYCRHRGSLLAEGSGNSSRLVCPYHAWSYGTDGRLLGCPDMKSAEDFDKSANGLAQLPVESWAGFVFTTFNEMAPHLIDTLGDLPERLASHRLDEMRCTWTITLEPRCNWKLILENAMETYHTGLVHRESVGA